MRPGDRAGLVLLRVGRGLCAPAPYEAAHQEEQGLAGARLRGMSERGLQHRLGAVMVVVLPARVLAVLVLVLGAGFVHGALPAALTAAVLACQSCGHAAPVPAGLPELGEDDRNGKVPLRAAVPDALVAAPVPRAPSGSAQPAGADVLAPLAPERLDGPLVVVVDALERARHFGKRSPSGCCSRRPYQRATVAADAPVCCMTQARLTTHRPPSVRRSALSPLITGTLSPCGQHYIMITNFDGRLHAGAGAGG